MRTQVRCHTKIYSGYCEGIVNSLKCNQQVSTELITHRSCNFRIVSP